MLVIDRFEGEWAVVEYKGRTFNLPRSLLPREVGEGSVIRISVTVDQEATKAREKTIERLADELFEE
ncbi:MAG: DUF3006 domain-containing protein [Thermacetogeniaceae bacterium]